MGYKFIKTLDEKNEHSNVNITFDIPYNDLTVDEILELFADFLRACSYQIRDGEIEYNPEGKDVQD